MELTLAENIRAFRKQRRLTQEQFAEVMGVTAGAVYKWESGMSVPELRLIAEMADFFDVSVDALLGYRMRGNQIASCIRRLSEYCRGRDPEALIEAEKALKKYPNSFEVVHACADVYLVFGTETGGREKLYRALELLEQSRLLVSQNRDPEISDLTICGEIAVAHSLAGEEEKGVEILKQNNIGGMFNDDIGVSLALFLGRPGEAEPYLSKAMLQSAGTLLNTITGYAFVFLSRNDNAAAQEILSWGIDFLLGLRKENAPDFLGKVYALLLVLLAHTQMSDGNTEDTRASVEKARELVRRFDAAPDYGLGTLRFAVIPESLSVHDSLGATAAESVEKMLVLLGDRELSRLWKEVSGNA